MSSTPVFNRKAELFFSQRNLKTADRTAPTLTSTFKASNSSGTKKKEENLAMLEWLNWCKCTTPSHLGVANGQTYKEKNGMEWKTLELWNPRTMEPGKFTPNFWIFPKKFSQNLFAKLFLQNCSYV